MKKKVHETWKNKIVLEGNRSGSEQLKKLNAKTKKIGKEFKG